MIRHETNCRHEEFPMQHMSKDDDVSITLFHGLEGVESLQSTWEDIISGMDRRRFFHLWEWYYSYLKCLAPDPGDLRFFLFKKGEAPVAIFPLQFAKISIGGLRLKALTFPPHDHLLLCDLICHRDALHLPLFQLLADHLRDQNQSWDLIQLPHLLEDACAIQVVHNHPPAKSLIKHEGRCDFLDATGNHESFLSGLSRNFRRNLKRAKQYLDEWPGYRFAFTQNGPELDERFEAFLDVEASGWKGALGSGTAIKLHPNLTCFYRMLGHKLSAAGKISINTLTADGKCIAAQYCILLDDTVYILKIGYDESYKRCAPGNLLVDLFLKRSMESGTVNNINLVTDAPWHEDWRPKSYAKSNLHIFNATPAGILGYVILRCHPIFKKHYQAYIQPHLPQWIQEWIERRSHET